MFEEFSKRRFTIFAIMRCSFLEKYVVTRVTVYNDKIHTHKFNVFDSFFSVTWSARGRRQFLVVAGHTHMRSDVAQVLFCNTPLMLHVEEDEIGRLRLKETCPCRREQTVNFLLTPRTEKQFFFFTLVEKLGCLALENPVLKKIMREMACNDER